MDLTAKHQPQRDRCWTEIEQFFGNLPQRLFLQGRLLQINLAARYSDTGQFKDILYRSYGYPLLDLHFWLLDDFNVPVGEERAEIERHVLQAMFFSFATIFTHESILDETSFFDNEYLFLAEELARQSTWHFVQLFPATSPFWHYHQTFWNGYADTALWKYRKQPEGAMPLDIEEAPELTGQWAPAKLSAAAVAIKTGQAARLPELFTLMEHLNFIFQIKQDISAIRRDAKQGRLTYPIVRTMMEAGIPLQSPFRPQRVMGAMVLNDAVAKICRECQDHLDAGRSVADALNLPTLKAYCAAVEEMIKTLLETFSFRKPAATTPSEPPIERKPKPLLTLTPYVEPLPKIIDMAEAYLLYDLTFRDSWEVHRHGMLGAPELVSRFPAGLIMEILCQHGHDMSAQIDQFYRNIRDAEFGYYEHPLAFPDTDSLGVLLRLYRFSKQQEFHRSILQIPLRWLEANIPESGRLPVWLTRKGDASVAEKPSALLLGENCGVVEAHLLLGLIDYDRTGYQGLIEKSAGQLLDRVTNDACGITLNYSRLYTPGIIFRLISELSTRSVQQPLRGRMSQATKALAERLEVETKRRRVTPQDAAFLILACLNPVAEHMFNPRWATILIKNQRFDGGWDGEPFYFTPNRGNVVTWYASHSLTTAFCYHALKTYAQWKEQAKR